MLGWLLCAALAHAQSLDSLLARGEVSLLETTPDGQLKQVTAIVQVAAPIDVVWATLTDFASYKDWMPQVRKSDVVSTERLSSEASSAGAVVVVDWTLTVVGPDVGFQARYTLDPARYTITGEHAGGALAGSRWEWRLESHNGGTLVYRTVRSNVVGSNWLLKQVEDDYHTIDYGINAAAALVEVRGLKRKLGG